jgi:hypothetical protein
VYLSNAKRRDGKKEFDAWAFRSGDSPFSTWKERKNLGIAMQAWVSKEAERHTFRVNLDRVIANMRKGESLEDIVTLCSAVESLDELKSPQTLTDKDLKNISKAAIAGAQEAGVTIDPARIRSVLALLKHQSLPQRLKLLMEAIAPHVSDNHAKAIISGALSLRTIAAHGGSIASLKIPRVSPIVTALAGACVLYDLLTSDFPPKANDHFRLRASRQIEEALDWMAHLEARAKVQKK